MLRHEPPPCERTFEIWHNLALEGVYRFGEPDPMRLVFTGSLLLPSTDPTGASYLFRLLSNLDDRGVRRCAAGPRARPPLPGRGSAAGDVGRPDRGRLRHLGRHPRLGPAGPPHPHRPSRIRHNEGIHP